MAKRILVIDDDDSIRELVTEILIDGGHEVVQARNGEHGLRSLEQDGALDLIMLDMRMPLVDGWQFASILAERGVEVPIVVMTAAQNARRWAGEIGAVGYVAKPFGIDELMDVVDTALAPANTTHELDAPLRWLAELWWALEVPRRAAVAPLP